MAERNYKKLQNGSDIRGIALPGVEGETPNLGEEEAERLSGGFLIWLAERAGKETRELKVAIGRDPRLSGESLLAAAGKAMMALGAEVLDCGLASTPAMFMSTIFPEFACDGAIMITASHLPFNRNGFKYFDREGGLNKGDISRVIALAESMEMQKADSGLRMRKANPDLMEVYSAHLRDLIRKGAGGPDYEKPLAGMKITVDAGNGGGGFYAEKVLAPLGADVSSSQFLEPDGTFPNHPPNPENRDAMASISKAVISAGSDFGLIFDTDVDRSAAVDRFGKEIARNGIVAMAAALIADEHPGTTVVTDSVTSDQLGVFLERKLGLKHLRFKRGYKNVINESIRLNAEGIDSQLAIETSGHGAFKENYFLDDGAYLATKIVIRAAMLRRFGQTLDSLISDLEEPKEAMEFRFPILCHDFGTYADEVLKGLSDFVTTGAAEREQLAVDAPECLQDASIMLVEPNYEGVRVSFGKGAGDGWCLLRKSLHDPIMPLNVESNREGGCRTICATLAACLRNYEDLDLQTLEKFISC